RRAAEHGRPVPLPYEGWREGWSDGVILDEAEALARGPGAAKLLSERAATDPWRTYAVEHGLITTVAEFDALVDRVAASLAEARVDAAARVAISLPTTVFHAAVIFAVLRTGALWVPLNNQLKGAPLEHLLTDSGATHLVADPAAEIVRAVDDVHRSRHHASLPAGEALPDPLDAGVRIWSIDADDVR